MKFNPGLEIGEEISNENLKNIFKCANTGGMRRSKRTGTLVLISDKTKGFYHDNWKDNILYYTGMGKTGDQVLEGNQNKTLFESNSNGVEVHLFEVLRKRVYTYKGIVKLAMNPYKRQEKDIDGNMRMVWVFPLKVIQDEIFTMKEERLQEETLFEELNVLNERELPENFTYVCQPKEKGKPVTVNQIEVWKRDRKVSLNALAYAKYLCEIDSEHKTFKRKKINVNYTEPHHLVPMKYSKEFQVSLDVEENIVSLCSNCHNLLHYGRDYKELLKSLYDKRKELLEKVGIVITYQQLEKMYE